MFVSLKVGFKFGSLSNFGQEIHADRKMRLLIMKDVRLGQLMGRAHLWMTLGRIVRLGTVQVVWIQRNGRIKPVEENE